MKLVVDWRSAHSWVRGYSDGLAGRSTEPAETTYDNAAYLRGHAHGRREQGAS